MFKEEIEAVVAIPIACRRDTFEEVAKEDSNNDFWDLCKGMSACVYLCVWFYKMLI